MDDADVDRFIAYLVVKNHEDQYSIWVASHPIPAGWTSCHGPASQEACLQHVRTVWMDMRPRSLRERTSSAGNDT